MCYSALVKRELQYLERKYGAVAVREQIDDYDYRSKRDPKRFPMLKDRIYPGYYAPVIFDKGGTRQIELMRYGTYPPATIKNPSRYTSYNARKDNLKSSFWSNAYRKHHGILILSGFFEWVSVSALIGAGVVSLNEVKTEFERQIEDRKRHVLAQGKTYRPTPTELKPPLERQIIIKFQPEDGLDLVVPVIFSTTILQEGTVDAGFAIVTDDPPDEIAAAGHDRCPVILGEESLSIWLTENRPDNAFSETFSDGKLVKFRHELAKAA